MFYLFISLLLIFKEKADKYKFLGIGIAIVAVLLIIHS